MNNLHVLIVGLCTLLLACGSEKEIFEETDTICPKAMLVDDLSEFSDSAPVNFEKVDLHGDILHIKINYSGGCKEHNFKLLGSKAIQKSLPPKRGIKLYHENADDHCRELISEELCFDISDFAYIGGGEIVLMMEGFETEIRYDPTSKED